MKISPQQLGFDQVQREWILKKIDECLETGQISQGKYVKELEEKFAQFHHIKHAIAVNSGSSAIEIVMRILNVKGKDVLVPTNTFLATATGVLYAGGNIKLVDADPETFCLKLNDIKKNVTDNTVGVIIVHIGGIITPEIEEIKTWCDQNGLWLYEDAAHAHGCSLNGKYAGSFGRAGSFSFFATKVMTSVEGGMIVTNDDEIAQKAFICRNHGKTEPWVSYHTHLGTNWRLNEITAVIGLSQLEHLKTFIDERNRVAHLYTELLSVKLPEATLILPKNQSNWYKYIVMLPKHINREILKTKLKAYGIGLAGEVYGIPLHQQPVFSHLNTGNHWPNADIICNRHICLPIYPGLKNSEAKEVAEVLVQVVHEMIK